MEEVDSVLASRDGTIWAGGPENLVSIRGRHVSSIQSHKGLPEIKLHRFLKIMPVGSGSE